MPLLTAHRVSSDSCNRATKIFVLKYCAGFVRDVSAVYDSLQQLSTEGAGSRKPDSGSEVALVRARDHLLRRMAVTHHTAYVICSWHHSDTVTIRLLQGQLRSRRLLTGLLPTPNQSILLWRCWRCTAIALWRTDKYLLCFLMINGLSASDSHVLVRRTSGENLQLHYLLCRNAGPTPICYTCLLYRHIGVLVWTTTS